MTMTDLIRRAEAIGIVEAAISDEHISARASLYMARAELTALPSAEVVLQTPQTYGKSINPSNAEVVADYISRADAIEAVKETLSGNVYWDYVCDALKALKALPSAEAVQGWIPCSERLPKVNQRVLLATNDGRVFVGYREKPDLVWQVTEKDGRKHWVYDPENYTDDIEILLKEDDCSFTEDNQYSDGFLSVTSINYDDRFEGVTAWMPLPKPYKGGDE